MKFKTEFRVLKLKDIVPPPYNPREDIVKGSDEYEAWSSTAWLSRLW